MKILRCAAVAALIALAALGARRALGQPGGIVVQGASATGTLGMSASSELTGLTAGLPARVLLEHASAVGDWVIAPLNNDLRALTDPLPQRILLSLAHANAIRGLAYPVGLIGDATAPVLTQLAVVPTGATSLRVSWTTDEIADSAVEVGLQPGAYTTTVTDAILGRAHEVTVSGLPAGTPLYLRARSQDRSANPGYSPEQAATLTISVRVFLPLVRR